MDYIYKEMTNNEISFEVNDNIGPCIPAPGPRGYRKMTVHMIFDVILDAGFTFKARIVEYIHKVDTSPSMTYASVVSQEIVIILLLLAVLNSLDVQYTGVPNAYLNANIKERVYFYDGEEFGKD